MRLSKQKLRNPMIILAAVALLGPAFAGCVTGDGGDGSASFYVKDAPRDDFDHVNVTFSEVRVHYAGDGGNESDEGEWITVVNESRTVDLLNFQDEGSRAFLGETNLTAGTYTQIRVIVDDAYGISADDGSRVDITVSSGTVKVVKSFDIAEGEETRVILDVDLDRSLREQGNGQWRMTPVIGKTIVEEGASGPNGDQPDEASASDGQSGGDGNGTAGTSQDGMAPMTAYVKDAPSDEFDEIWVEFDTVQVHFAGNGSDDEDETEDDDNETVDLEEEGNETASNETGGNESAGNETGGNETGGEPLEEQSTDENETDEDDGRWITVFNGTKQVDLLRFNETGAKAFLGEADVPTGRYTQIRINVTDAWGMKDGNRTNITVSSGTAKVVRSWEVSDNGTIAQVTVDLDLEKSVREQGNGEWRMTPVVGKVLVDHVKDDPRADQPNQGQSQQGSDDGQGQGGNQSAQAKGNASAYVKDAPTDEFDEIWLNLSEVRVHWAGDDDNGTWVTLFNGSREVNLLNFSEEGAKAFLGNGSIPVGNYTQIRLNVTDTWGIKDGNRTNITLASGSAMIVRPFEVTENGTTEIVIDVDLDQSLRQQGNGEWRMTPVIGKVLVDHTDEPTNADVPDSA